VIARDATGVSHVFGFDEDFREMGYALVP